MIDIIKGIDTDTGAIADTKKGSKAGVWVTLFCLVALAAGGSYWMKTHSKPAVVLSYYSSDAVVLPANQEMLTNKGDITKAWMTLLDRSNTVSWNSMYVEASQSGEMVYDVGSYTLTTKVKNGKPTTDHGKYLAVWKKQADGSWKAVADTWNSDLPVKK